MEVVVVYYVVVVVQGRLVKSKSSSNLVNLSWIRTFSDGITSGLIDGESHRW